MRKDAPFVLYSTPIEWVTKKNLSEITGVSISTIERLMRNAEIEMKKVGTGKSGRVLLSIPSFNSWVNRQKSA